MNIDFYILIHKYNSCWVKCRISQSARLALYTNGSSHYSTPNKQFATYYVLS